MCNSCNDRNGSCSSIIWILLIYYLLGDNCGCGCDNGFGRGGGSNSCIWIILLLACCGGNGFSLGNNGCCERQSYGCDRPTPCGCN